MEAGLGNSLRENWAYPRCRTNLPAIRAALCCAPQAIDICVRSHAMQRWAAWFGGSLLACGPSFGQLVTTREQYMEQGPRWERGWLGAGAGGWVEGEGNGSESTGKGGSTSVAHGRDGCCERPRVP